MNRPSKQVIIDTIIGRINAETTLLVDQKNSNVGRMVTIFADEVDKLWDYLVELEKQSKLTSATGIYLDGWGERLGLARNTNSKSSTIGLERSVRFTNLAGSVALIPAGIRVYKSTDPAVSFFTTENLSVGVGTSEDAHVVASATGSFYNIGAGEIDSHNIPNVSVTVTNILPIENGNEDETDTSYRFRLLQEFQRRNITNESNFGSLFRSIPGVKDVLTYNGKRGPGTIDVILFPNNFKDQNTLLRLANQLAAEAAPVGIDYKIYLPRTIPVDVSVILLLKQGVVGDIRQQVSNAVNAYISGLDSGVPPTLTVNQLIARVIDSSSKISNATVLVSINGTNIQANGFFSAKTDDKFILNSLKIS